MSITLIDSIDGSADYESCSKTKGSVERRGRKQFYEQNFIGAGFCLKYEKRDTANFESFEWNFLENLGELTVKLQKNFTNF